MSLSIPVSVRIPQEDFEWLSALELDAAATPSDKLRAVIQRYRREHDGARSYELALDWLRDLLRPTLRDIAAHEHASGERSEILATLIEWVPQLMALLASANIAGQGAAARAHDLEQRLLQGGVALLGALLRLGLAPAGAVYDEEAFARQLPRLVGLIELQHAVREARPASSV